MASFVVRHLNLVASWNSAVLFLNAKAHVFFPQDRTQTIDWRVFHVTPVMPALKDDTKYEDLLRAILATQGQTLEQQTWIPAKMKVQLARAVAQHGAIHCEAALMGLAVNASDIERQLSADARTVRLFICTTNLSADAQEP